MTPEQRIQILEDQVAALQEALGLAYDPPMEWGLTKTEAELFGILKRSPVVLRDRMRTALYGLWADPPLTNVIAVHVCHMRRKLAPFGISIKASRDGRYWIPQEQKARLLDA